MIAIYYLESLCFIAFLVFLLVSVRVIAEYIYYCARSSEDYDLTFIEWIKKYNIK